MTDRRELLKTLTAAVGVAWLPRALRAAAPALPEYPFTCGVASGYPTDRSVVLWTRLAPHADQPGGGMPPQDVPLRHEVATDENFRRIVKRGESVAEARFAHSVHQEVKGLDPSREYWYRFMVGDHASASGRTRTLPAPRDAEELRIVLACCQNYEHGHYAAWRHMIATPPRMVVFVGDYIYENNQRGNAVRRHTGGVAQSLDEYRQRYALYQSDPALQAAHGVAPWFAVWDDHEVVNDYAGTTPGRQEDPDAFLVRRAAAYQAWYEHLPVPPAMAPRSGVMNIQARARLGRLAMLHLLDQRQYRSAEACPRPPQLGGQRVGDDCAERVDAARTMLGMQQERWLEEGLRQNGAPWTLLAQGTPFTHINQGTVEKPEYAADAWTGYPAARQRLIDSLQRTRTANPVILGGDIHAFLVGGVNAVPERPDSALVASEFVTTSISSNPLPQATLDKWLANGPNLRKVDGTHRGYVALTLSPKQLRVDLVQVEDVARPDSPSRIESSWVVEAGSPAIQPA
jgi:alkaline phosphatase D